MSGSIEPLEPLSLKAAHIDPLLEKIEKNKINKNTVGPIWGNQTCKISVNTKLKICRNQTEFGLYRYNLLTSLLYTDFLQVWFPQIGATALAIYRTNGS